MDGIAIGVDHEERRRPLGGKELLRTLLNKTLRIRLTAGRTLVGQFLCVDRDCNIIIGSSSEYSNDKLEGEPRILGLSMIPGRHAKSIQVYKKDLEGGFV